MLLDWGQMECSLLFSNRSLRGSYCWYSWRGGAGSLGWGSLWPAYTDPSCASQQQAVRRSRHTTAQYSTHIITLGSWRRAEKRETSDLYYNKSTTPLHWCDGDEPVRHHGVRVHLRVLGAEQAAPRPGWRAHRAGPRQDRGQPRQRRGQRWGQTGAGLLIPTLQVCKVSNFHIMYPTNQDTSYFNDSKNVILSSRRSYYLDSRHGIFHPTKGRGLLWFSVLSVIFYKNIFVKFFFQE